MQYQPDVVISDHSGAPLAIVEVKALNGASAQVAIRYLRNLFAHGSVPRADYALLVTESTGYLWNAPRDVLREQAPALTFPMDRIVQHYLPAGSGSVPVRDLVLASIVEHWLADLADGVTVDDRVTNALQQVGFLKVVRDGKISIQATA